MTIYRQTANPNATNSELDAKKIVYPPIVDCDLPVTLTEGQISTILYVLEGYIQGSDEYHFNDDFTRDVDNIFYKLETAVDHHHDMLDAVCKEK